MGSDWGYQVLSNGTQIRQEKSVNHPTCRRHRTPTNGNVPARKITFCVPLKSSVRSYISRVTSVDALKIGEVTSRTYFGQRCDDLFRFVSIKIVKKMLCELLRYALLMVSLGRCSRMRHCLAPVVLMYFWVGFGSDTSNFRKLVPRKGD